MEALRVHPGSVSGDLEAPPSKSYTHRFLLLALLARGRSRLEKPLYSDDTEATMDVLERLGARLEKTRGSVAVESPGPGGLGWSPSLDARESGTTLRLSAGVAALLDKPVVLHGRGRLHERPVAPLAGALRLLGVEAAVSRGCCPPVAVRGPPRGRWTLVDAGLSSQFLSSLLLLGAGLGGLTVEAAALSSRPYVEMTIRAMEAFGVRVSVSGSTYTVEGRPRPVDARVPGDWSSAASILAAAAAAGGKVGLAGLDPLDPHPDSRIVELLSRMGASCWWSGGLLACRGPGPGGLEAVETCIDDSPDLAPALAAAAAVACGVSRICCADRLRVKESDRAAAIIDVLGRLGVEARLEETRERGLCIVIRGACGPVEGGVALPSHGDHRIAMMAAALCLASRRGCIVEDPGVVAKSYPGFWRDLERLGARLEPA